jgi:CcmD family protein
VADLFAQNALYIVLIIALVVWLGIYGYLFRIEHRLRELEKRTPTHKG